MKCWLIVCVTFLPSKIEITHTSRQQHRLEQISQAMNALKFTTAKIGILKAFSFGSRA